MNKSEQKPCQKHGRHDHFYVQQGQIVTFSPILRREKKTVAITSYQEKLDLTHHDAST